MSNDYRTPVSLDITEDVYFNFYEYKSEIDSSKSLPIEVCDRVQPEFSAYFEFTVPETGQVSIELELDKSLYFGLALYVISDETYEKVMCNIFIGDNGKTFLSSNERADYSGKNILLRFWTLDEHYSGDIRINAANKSIFPEKLPKTKTPTPTTRNQDDLIVDVGSYTPQQLVQDILAAGCVETFNINYTGHSQSIGYFSNANHLIGVDAGIILSTGLAAEAVGPNQGFNNSNWNSRIASTEMNTPGDADLSAIVGANTFDAAVLEFEFVPESDSLEFNYVFASEEYPRYVGTQYNDVFAFLISGGPEDYDNENIALIPGTQTPVAINNVNHQTNTEYYVVNLICSGSQWNWSCVLPEDPINIEYNGFTVPLTAFANVTACHTYTIKMAIADVADRRWDSAVFLEAGSFISGDGVNVESFNLYSEEVQPVTQTEYLGSTESNTNGEYNYSSISYVGNTDSDTNGSFHNNNNFHLLFDALNEFRLISVEVNAQSEGDRIIQLRNSSSQVIESTTVFIPEGVSRIELDFIVPMGQNYQIRCGTSNPDLWRNDSEVDYPYTIENLVSITNSSATSPGYYYYFYDWEVEDLSRHYLEFDAEINFTLNSVEVNAETEGERTIELWNNFNQVVESVTVNIPQGTSRVDLNFPIDQGSGYKLVADNIASNLWKNTSGATFPYELPGVASITGSSGSADEYYFFYDWEVEFTEILAVIPVMQGCTNVLQFCRTPGAPMEEPLIISLGYGGGAVPGVHYSVLPNNFTIPAEEECLEVDFMAFFTGLQDPVSLILYMDLGCPCEDLNEYIILIEPPFDISPEISNSGPICYGDTATIELILNSENDEVVSVEWSNESTSKTGFDVAPSETTTYTADITYPCSQTSSSTTLVVNPLPDVDIELTDPLCYQDCNGQILITTELEAANFIYSIDQGENFQSSGLFADLCAGEYNILIISEFGCITDTTVILVEPDELITSTFVTSNYNGEDVSCFGANDGIAMVQATGGTGAHSFLWDANAGNQITQTADSLTAGIYYVTVTDENACEAVDSILIAEPELLTADIEVSSDFNGFDISCFGQNDGSAIVLPAGGTEPYEYSWDESANNQTTQEATELTAGTYFVTVTDINGCEIIKDIIINEPDELILSAEVTSDFNGQDISCFGFEDGSAIVNPTGGTGNYSYLWDENADNQTTQEATNLSAGTYTVLVADDNQCTTSIEVTLTDPDELITDVEITSDYSGEDISCFGNADGVATVMASGGTGAYHYLWDENAGEQTTPEVSGLQAGTYFVTITDDNGCSSVEEITLSEPELLTGSISIVSDYNGQDISCFGANDGFATYIVEGGTGTYSFIWDENAGNQTTQTADSLTAGMYYVTVTDENACEAVDSILIAEPELLTADIEVSSDFNGFDISCFGQNDGSAIVLPAGGTEPYEYSWDENANNQITQEATELTAGTYFVTVTDINGCEIIKNITINQPDELILSAEVTSDFNGQDISCFGFEDGSAIVNPAGGAGNYSYLWDENADNQTSQEATNLSAGTYIVLVADENQCTTSIEVTLTDPDELITDIEITSDYSGEDISCFGNADGVATVMASGGIGAYYYLWDENAGEQTTPEVSGLQAGTYSVTITDDNGCSSIEEITLSEPELLTGNISIVSDYNGQDISCFGANDGFATYIVEGGTGSYFFIWDENAGSQTTQTADSLTAGIYYVTVTDENACEAVDSILIAEPELLTADIEVSSDFNGFDISCFGQNDGSAIVLPAGGTEPYSYTWDENANNQITQEATELTAGTYFVTVTDINGCEIIKDITINQPDELILSAEVTSDFNGQDISCFGFEDGSAIVNPTGGAGNYSYLWDENADNQTTQEATNLSAGTYTVLVADDNQCTTSIEVTLTEPDELITDIEVTSYYEGEHISCSGANDGSAIVLPTGGTEPYSYSWDENANNQTSQEATELAAGEFLVTVTDINGCVSVNSIELVEPESITAEITITSDYNGQHISCFGNNDASAIVIADGGTLPYSYLWDENANNQTTPEALNLAAGTYFVTVTDDNGCFIVEEILIEDPPELLAIVSATSDYNGENISCFGEADASAIALPEGGVEPYEYLWDENANSQVSQEAIELSAGTYFVTITDANNCSTVQSIEITEPPEIIVSTFVTSDYFGQDISCFGFSDGAASVSASGGAEPYTYLWDENADSQTGQEAIELSSGTYFVTVFDSNNCVNTSEITLSEPEQLTADLSVTSDYNGEHISCYGLNDASTIAISLGGTEPYSYLWDENADNQTTQEAHNLSAGTYQVTITDVNACEIIEEVIISEPEQILSATSVTSSYNDMDISCHNSSDGSAIVDITGGTEPYSYLWDENANNQETQEAVDLSAGVYYITVFDANSCSITDSITITAPPELTAELSVSSDFEGEDISCFGAADASAIAVPDGGVAPYSFQWDENAGSQTTQEAINLSAGTYSVTISDSNNCSIVKEITIVEPEEIAAEIFVSSDFNGEHISCFGENDGSAEVNVTGGTAPYLFLWDENADNQTTQEAENLSAGTYFVTITDANNCQTIKEISIINPEILDADIEISSDYNGEDISCFGFADGMAIALPSGGVEPYTYLWDENAGSQTSQEAENLAAGTYFITITDANDCQIVKSIELSQPEELLSEISVSSNYNGNDISCYNFSDGSALVTASQGTEPYTYLWDENAGSQTSAEATNLSAGSYFVTITDANNCFVVNEISLTQPEQLLTAISVSSDFNGEDISCFGASDGSAIVIAEGGTEPYTYLWDENAGNQTSSEAENLSSGYYYVTVIDINNCEVEDSIFIDEPEQLLLSGEVTSDFEGQDLSCSGANDGSAIVYASGGLEPYSYQWDENADNQTTQEAENLGAGTYFVTVTDNNYCYEVFEITLIEPEDLMAETFVTSDFNGQEVSCFGASDGSAIVQASGGTEPYFYLWDENADNQETQEAHNLSAGTYQVTITDSNDCFIVSEVTVTDAEQLTATAQPTSDYEAYEISCYGFSDGSAIVFGEGGAEPYTYLWDENANEQTTQEAFELAAGTYHVSVIDANGCVAQAEVILTEPEQINAVTEVSSDYNGQDISCFGFSDGSATIFAENGNPPYSYAWTIGQDTVFAQEVTGLSSGTYSVTVTDANECYTVAEVTLHDPEELLVSLEVSSDYSGYDISCSGLADGSAIAMPLGGTEPYTYQWDENANNQTTAEADSLPAGVFFVTITDANNCSAVGSIELSEPEDFAIVEVSSDYNGQDISCYGYSDGAALVTVLAGTPPFNIQWDENANHQNTAEAINLSAGTYSVSVNDAVGCWVELSIDLTEPEELNSEVFVSSDYNGEDIRCYGGSDGSATVNASGGTYPYNYQWDSNANSQIGSEANLLSANQYFVTITDINNCTTVDSISLANPEQLTATGAVNTSFNGFGVSCYNSKDGQAEVTPEGGTEPYTYIWDNNAGNQQTQIATALGAGQYFVTVLDANHCHYSTYVELTQPEEISISFADIYPTECFGSEDGGATAIGLGGVPPYNYQWSDVNQTQDSVLSNAFANLYTVSVTDANSCLKTETLLIHQPPPITIQANIQPVICGSSYGSINVSAVGGHPEYFYEWDNGESGSFINQLTTGFYTVTVIDQKNCRNSIELEVDKQGSLSVGIIEKGKISCHGDDNGTLIAKIASGVPDFNYEWEGFSTNDSIITGLTSGYYSVTITDRWGCVGSSSYFISEPDSIALSMSKTNVSCANGKDGSLFVRANGGQPPYSAVWSNNVSTFNNPGLSAGSYTVTITDANECTASITGNISEPADPLKVSYTINPISCYDYNDASIISTATGGTEPYSFTWQSSSGTSYTGSAIYNLPEGFYYLTITDENNCSLDTTIFVDGPQGMLAASYIKSSPSCFEHNDGYIIVNVNGGTKPYSYYFNDQIYLEGEFLDLADGYYGIAIEDDRNCKIYLDTIVLVDNENHCLVIPNAITPNGDGINDTWVIENIDRYPDAVISVYNRWGQMLWQGNKSDKWDGTYNGRNLPIGSYLFIIELSDHFDPIIGHISIVY